MNAAQELLRAKVRAKHMYGGTQFASAYTAGASAALAGRSRAHCPYKRDGWRAWATAWKRGFDSIRPEPLDS